MVTEFSPDDILLPALRERQDPLVDELIRRYEDHQKWEDTAREFADDYERFRQLTRAIVTFIAQIQE
jgi:hypothetical protein